MAFCFGFYNGKKPPPSRDDTGGLLSLGRFWADQSHVVQTVTDDLFMVSGDPSFCTVANGHLILRRPSLDAPPVFYFPSAGGVFFSTHRGPLMARLAGNGRQGPVHSFARDGLLQRGYVSGPYTLIQGINRVLPGETVTVAPDLTITYGAAWPSISKFENNLENRILLLDGTARGFQAAIHQKQTYPNAPPPVWVFYDDPLQKPSLYHKKLADLGIFPRLVPVGEKQFWEFLPRAASSCLNPVFSLLWPLYLFAFETYPNISWVITHDHFPLIHPDRRRFLGIPLPDQRLWNSLPPTPWKIDAVSLCAHYGTTKQQKRHLLSLIQTDESLCSPLAEITPKPDVRYGKIGAIDPCPERAEASCFYPLTWVYHKRLRLSPLIARVSAIDDILARGDVYRLLARGGGFRWASYRLLLYALWYQHHGEGLTLPPDTPSALIKRANPQTPDNTGKK